MEKTTPGASDDLKKSLLATTLVYLTTAFHHYYGAIVYNTPWRKDVVTQGALILAIACTGYLLYRRLHRKGWLLLYLLVSFLVFGLAIGVVEGAYNHVLKNILYFGGLNASAWRKLFPAPAYEMPDNILFESTGILQCFLGIAQVRYLWRAWKTNYRQP